MDTPIKTRFPAPVRRKSYIPVFLIRCSLSFDAAYCALGRDKAVATATELQTGRSGNRIPVAATFSVLIQIDPEPHPASCTTGTKSFPGVKRPESGVDHPPTSRGEVKKEQSYTSTSLLCLHGIIGYTLQL